MAVGAVGESPQTAAGGGSPNPAAEAAAQSPPEGAESLQEAAIAHFSTRAEALLPPDGAPLSEDAAVKLADVVMEAISHPFIFSFSELVALPAISATVPLDKLMKEIEISDMRQLRIFLTNFCEQLGLSGESTSLENGNFQMNNMPNLRVVSTVIEESLEVYLQEAACVVCDANTGLLRNDIVRHVKVPLDPFDLSQFYYHSSNIFSQIVALVTEGHLTGKSWNGNIYPGMFVLVGGQVFLRPEAAATRNITGQYSSHDLAVEAMLKEYTGLKFVYIHRDGSQREIMYPIYMGNLFKHLNGKTKQLTKAHIADPMAKAMDISYVVFLRCHSTFQTTAAMSVFLYHVRCHHSTSNVTEQHDFDLALRKVTVRGNWHAQLKVHPLFQGCFDFAENINADYLNTPNGCCRLIRDWGTHCLKYLNEQEKQIYTEVVRVYLVEYYFDDFVPETLYRLLCDYCTKHPNFDLQGFLLKLQRVCIKNAGKILTSKLQRILL